MASGGVAEVGRRRPWGLPYLPRTRIYGGASATLKLLRFCAAVLPQAEPRHTSALSSPPFFASPRCGSALRLAMPLLRSTRRHASALRLVDAGREGALELLCLRLLRLRVGVEAARGRPWRSARGRVGRGRVRWLAGRRM